MHTGDEQAYRALLGRLFAARRFGMRLELERIERCLERLGRPQRAARAVVQVGGTNGKGSTAAFIDAVLRAGGVTTGLYASPHLLRLTERFRVGGAELTPAEVVDADRAVAAAAAGAGVELTFFEEVTAIAVVAFAARGVDVMVLEVGMGGRHDATTAVGAGVAVVTGVALDHQEHLGATLEAIAGEKAGIFRAGQRAVVGAAGEPEAVPLLSAAARARGVAALTVIDPAAADALALPLGLA
ncbi:MAG TPA: Mur ligase family protein, partial [Kofleriaceae bacterium]|nr:Mur ligase family protein [Kofleriaceae bacterium]